MPAGGCAINQNKLIKIMIQIDGVVWIVFACYQRIFFCIHEDRVNKDLKEHLGLDNEWAISTLA